MGNIVMMMDFFKLQGCESELREIVSLDFGVISYLYRYWRGTYPLLLIEVLSKGIPVDDVSSCGNSLRM